MANQYQCDWKRFVEIINSKKNITWITVVDSLGDTPQAISTVIKDEEEDE